MAGERVARRDSGVSGYNQRLAVYEQDEAFCISITQVSDESSHPHVA
jgi:hypothetical protein